MFLRPAVNVSLWIILAGWAHHQPQQQSRRPGHQHLWHAVQARKDSCLAHIPGESLDSKLCGGRCNAGVWPLKDGHVLSVVARHNLCMRAHVLACAHYGPSEHASTCKLLLLSPQSSTSRTYHT